MHKPLILWIIYKKINVARNFEYVHWEVTVYPLGTLHNLKTRFLKEFTARWADYFCQQIAIPNGANHCI